MINEIKPTFSELDVKVLNSFSEEEIQEYIDFFISYRELMWLNSDTNELIKDSEIKKIQLHTQPIPQYPKELKKLCIKFDCIGEENEYKLSSEEYKNNCSMKGVFPCTYFTPSLICAFFRELYNHNPFFDGLLGSGIKDNRYLKMMLHLQDCKRIYHHSV